MKKLARITVFTHLVAIATLLIGLTITSACQTQSLDYPLKTVVFSDTSHTGRSAPVFQNGALVQFLFNPSGPGESNVFIYDLGGSKAKALTVWPTGSDRIKLTAASFGTDGFVSVAGIRYSSGVATPFLESLRQDGTVIQATNTDPYLATQICRLTDGSVWTVGVSHSEVSTDPSAPRRYLNYDTLRHYSGSGQIIGSFLPRWGSDVDYVTKVSENGHLVLSGHSRSNQPDVVYGPPAYGPNAGFRTAGSRASRVYIAPYSQGVVIYDSKNGMLHLWSSATSSLTSWRTTKMLDELSVDGLAVLEDGTILASRRGTSTVLANGKSQSTNIQDIYELRTGDHGFATWKAVNKPADLPKAIHVIGSDRSALVYSNGNNLSMGLAWSKVHTE
jgi:hypothetical protein